MILFFLLLLPTLGSAHLHAGHSILDRVDPSFNPQIAANLYGSKIVQQLETLPDGKILAFGQFNSYNRIPTGQLVRLNADGSFDQTFNNQTITSSGICDPRTKIIVQPDGKIILACNDMVANGQAPKNLLRLNSNGTLDTNFNYTFGSAISGIALDSLGRIAVHGRFQTPLGTRFVVRLNSDGSLDNSFNFTINLSTVYMTAQGSRVIVGDTRIIRLNENGSEDTTFAPPNINGFISQMLTQPDNKILYLKGNGIFRLNENGGNDTSFQSTTFSINGNPMMKLAADGKIVVSALSSSSTFQRFLANGGVDQSFTAYSFSASAEGNFAIQPDGSLILGDVYTRTTTQGINNFIRLTSAGAPDPTFNSGGIAFQTILPGSIRTIEPLSDGKIFLGGKFDMINNLTRPKIARLNADSTVDSSFQINTSGSGNYFSMILDVYHIRAQTDGKIIVSGWFDYVANGVTKKNLVRLNQDGSIDATFNLTETINDWSEIAGAGRNRFVIFSDGKLAIGISRLNNFGPVGPLKFKQNGSLDTSFTSVLNSQSPQMFIDDVALQPDGKILVVGSYDPDFTGHKTFVARLNTDGSLDPTFQYTEEIGRLKPTLALLPNGKILISKNASGTSPATVKRLNADGSPDASFSSLSLPNGIVNALLVLPNGEIFVGGKFTISVNGQTSKNLLRLSENGNINSTIYNLNEEVLSLAIDGEGRVLVGGVFTIINAGGGDSAANRTYIARLTDSPPRFDFDGDGKADVSVFRPENGTWYLQQSANGFTGVTFGQSGDKIVSADYDGDGKTDVAVFRAGTWYLQRSQLGFTGVGFGAADDIPIPADYDGDGKADLAVFRPSTGAWYLLQSTLGFVGTTFGQNGDVPVPADYDGDGKADTAVFRSGTWYIQRTRLGFTGIGFGQSGDKAVPADYDGDGTADIAVFRAGTWYLLQSTAGFTGIAFGQAGDLPVAADYDGDGKTDVSVYRSGTWYLSRSTAGFTGVAFGAGTDLPIPGAFVQ